jgi:hypothetical protein
LVRRRERGVLQVWEWERATLALVALSVWKRAAFQPDWAVNRLLVQRLLAGYKADREI